MGAGRSFVGLETCEKERAAMQAERDALIERCARLEAENEHLKAALWLAQHPGQRAAQTQEVGR